MEQAAAGSLDDARRQVQDLADQTAPEPVPTFTPGPLPTFTLGPEPTFSAVPSTAPPPGSGG